MTTGEAIDLLQGVPRDTPFLIRAEGRWGEFVSAKVWTTTAKSDDRGRWGENWNRPAQNAPTVILVQQED